MRAQRAAAPDTTLAQIAAACTSRSHRATPPRQGGWVAEFPLGLRRREVHGLSRHAHPIRGHQRSAPMPRTGDRLGDHGRRQQGGDGRRSRGVCDRPIGDLGKHLPERQVVATENVERRRYARARMPEDVLRHVVHVDQIEACRRRRGCVPRRLRAGRPVGVGRASAGPTGLKIDGSRPAAHVGDQRATRLLGQVSSVCRFEIKSASAAGVVLVGGQTIGPKSQGCTLLV